MMHWYWKVRIYNKKGTYWHAQIITARELKEIDAMQDFYFTLTGCKMLIEGMSETEDPHHDLLQEAFEGIWRDAP